MKIVLFEDRHVERLHPITLGRPAFAVRCGSFRLIDLLAELGMPIEARIRPQMRDLVKADYPLIGGRPASEDDRELLVNARMVPSVEIVQRLKALADAGQPAIVAGDDCVAAALLKPGEATPNGGDRRIEAVLAGLKLPPAGVELPLFDYPHDVVRHHCEILSENLQHRLAGGDYEQVADGVFVGPRTSLGQHLVTDTKNGPIVIEADATIGPFCYLSGPVHIGRGARVIEHAAIKDHVALGHTTKIGGEVEASIVEPYTNKQHHGFLGHSYLGSWINLGAGTCNSDLKNTYGNVNMQYADGRVATGMQFIGCIMGPYSKTAINTGIFTGKTVGACSMLYGFVTTNVPSFVNYARSFGQVTATTVDVMIATQARMFARRDVPQRPCDIQLIRDMYELTQEERQLADVSLSL
jgi:glucose-1-phosphate thymidylyltransferase